VPLELEEEIILPAGMENAPALHFARPHGDGRLRTPLTAKNRAAVSGKSVSKFSIVQTMSNTASVSTSNRSCAAAISGHLKIAFDD